MRKYLASLLTLGLVAAAFFLPVHLARWGDAQLLDVPHITAEAEREGFAETLQLTSGEKLLMLRSGDVSSMEVGAFRVQGLFTTPIPGENGSPGSIEHGEIGVGSEIQLPYNNHSSDGEEPWTKFSLDMLDLQLWAERVESAWSEVRTLQSLGGLPDLWTPGVSLEYSVYGDRLYVDAATQVSFQTFRISFSCAPYTLDMTVDVQSGRVFAFSLLWDKGTQLSWGPRGSGSFGTAWRDYWKLDKVSAGWNSSYVKEILESPAESLNLNGEYNANGQVVFTYDGQSLAVSLSNWLYSGWSGALQWNMY